jgi:hypothetical protein
MPNDDDLTNLEHQVDRHERELEIDGKDIEQLKKDIIDLRQDVTDLLEILGFSRQVPVCSTKRASPGREADL